MKVAVVGATGLVGGEILKVLEEFAFPVSTLLPVASAASVGKEVVFRGTPQRVIGMEEALAARPHLAIFSAGGQTSLDWAPRFAAAGTTVIDNSSAWRMHPDHKLIVPEINGASLNEGDKIIANPNCSTIQMVLALSKLHASFGLKRIVVATYQSVTGTGKAAVDQLMAERAGREAPKVYPHPIDLNVLPHIDVFLDNGYTKEEMKMVQETRKIFNDPAIGVTATAVRLPVMGGHAEAVNAEFGRNFSLDEVYELLRATPGLEVVDNPAANEYPMPLYARGSNQVFVGRVRLDESRPNTLNMWVVADNLRKGAATNAVQIARYLLDHNLFHE